MAHISIRDPLVLSIYHEILQNEIAIMRGNYPIFSGIRLENAVYYTTPFPQFTSTNNPRRALDFAILSYAIINGLRRYLCGYDLTRPYTWEERNICICMKKILKETERIVDRKLSSLTELLSELILKLIDLGLIKPIPETAIDPDNLRPLEYIINNTNNLLTNKDIPVVVNNDVDFVSLAVAKTLIEFFDIKCEKQGQIWSINDVLIAENIVLDRMGLNNIGVNIYYKTLHGELLRAAANAASLPGHLANFEARVLPFIAEPPPPTTNLDEIGIDVDKLEKPLEEFLKRIKIDRRDIIMNVVGGIIEGLKKAGFTKLNPYQYNYLYKLLKSGPGGSLAILSSPTGSGKTLVFTIYIVALTLAAKLKGKKPLSMIIYPRKTLARDQLARLINIFYHINKSLKQKGLDVVLTVAIRDGDSMEKSNLGTLRPLREVTINIGGNQFLVCHGFTNDEKYVVSLCNSNCNICVESLEWVYDIKERIRIGNRYTNVSGLKEVDVVITNSAMFTKMSIDLYKPGGSSRREWIERLRLLVLDEAHVYLDPEELEKLLFALMRILMYVKTDNNGTTVKKVSDLVRTNTLDVIVSSATITESNLFSIISKEKVYTLDSKNVLGISRIPSCLKNNEEIPKEVLYFAERLLGSPLFNEFKNKLIYMDYYHEIICSSGRIPQKDKLKGTIKLNIYGVTFPLPSKNSWTSLAETMISIIHWINELRRRGLKRALALIFIDNKDSQRNIARVFAQRQILEALDHIDRILLTPIDKYAHSRLLSMSSSAKREGYKRITQELIARGQKRIISLYEAIWDIGNIGTYSFANFHNLSFYQDTKLIRELIDKVLPKNESRLSNLMRNIASLKPLIDFSDNVIEYGNIFLNKRGQRNPLAAVMEAMNNNIPIIYVVHNADLDKDTRMRLEEILKDGKPYIVLTTSTLEVGIDIPSVVLVVQYAATTGTAELTQRIGRSGRNADSLFVSTGLLVLRNNGADVHYINEDNVIDYVFNLTLPPLPDYLNDAQAIGRNILSVLRYIEGNINDIEDLLKQFLEFIEAEKTVSKKVEIILDSISWYIVNYNREISSLVNNRYTSLNNLSNNIRQQANSIKLLLNNKSVRNIIPSSVSVTSYNYILDVTRRIPIDKDRSWSIVLLRNMLEFYEILKGVYLNKCTRMNIGCKYLEKLISDLEKLNENTFKILVINQVKEIGEVLGNRYNNIYKEVVEANYGRLIYPGLIGNLGRLEERYIELKFLDNPNRPKINKLENYVEFIRRVAPVKHRE